MNRSTLNYFITAFLLFLGIALLIFGVQFLEGKSGGEKTTYYALFPNIGSLRKGDPVNVTGVPLGEVLKVELWEKQVKVAFSLKTEIIDDETGVSHPLRIPINSQIKVENIGLMGEREINIVFGSSAEYLLPNQILKTKGLYESGIPEVMGKTGLLLDHGDSVLKSLSYQTTQILENFSNESSKALISLNRTLQHLESTSRLLQSLNQPMERITKNLDELTSDLTIIADTLSDSTFLYQLSNIVRNLDSITTDILTTKKIKVNVDLF